MAPTPELTDAQKHTDEQLNRLLKAYLALDSGLGVAGVHPVLGRQIVDLVRKRNGADAAKKVATAVRNGANPVPLLRGLPRIDADADRNSKPSVPVPASAPPAPSGAYDAAPGDGRVWLPSNAGLPALSKAGDEAIDKADAAIEQINQTRFGVDPDDAWHPSGASLKSTGANISTLGGAYEQAKDLLPRWKAAVDALSAAFSGTGEPLIDAQYERLKPALASLASSAEASRDLHSMIARSGVAANNAFHHCLRGSNLAARTVIGQAVTAHGLRHGRPGGHPNTGLSLTNLDARVRSGDPAPTVADEAAKISHLASAISVPAAVFPAYVPAAELHDRSNAAGTEKPASAPGASAATAPAAPAARFGGPVGASPSAGAGTPGKVSAADLHRLLAAMGNQGFPPAAQQAAAVPQQAANAAQQAARPVADAAQRAARSPQDLLKSLQGDRPENLKAHPAAAVTPASDAANKDRKAATSKTFTMPGAAAPDKIGSPGSAARAHQLDANGNPVDKDHDGKVDKDAVALSKKTVKPFDLALDAHGQNRQVAGVPDPRVGEMMLNMAGASDGKPMSVLDAAKASGMSIESLGDPIAKDKIEVGDAVIGEAKSGMYLGGGDVLTSTGRVENLDDVLGDEGLVSQIPLPELPDEVPAPAVSPVEPVSGLGSAEPVHAETSAPVPVGEPQLTPPSEKAPAAGPAPVPAPGPVPEPPDPPAAAPDPAPQPPAPPAAVPGPVSVPGPVAASAPSAGPRQVPYEGHALG